LARQTRCGCPAELEVAFDLGSRAAVEPLEDPFTLLRAEPVHELVSADSSHLDRVVLLSQHSRHRLGKVAVAGNTYRSPFARPANRPLLPPPTRDDEEITLAKDRACMLAARPDATTPRPTY
jgi:hypothetical protein